MDRPAAGAVVAGVDGSARSVPVLRWAYEQAHLTGARLIAVTAFGGEPGRPPWPDENAASAALETLQTAIVTALGAGRAPDVEARTAPQLPGAALIAESQWADLVVLGGHHREPLHPLRSVVAQVAGGADGPVAVVRTHQAGGRRSIVVGVDGSPDSRCALEWAARQAVDADGTVDAVLAWEWEPEYAVFPYGSRRDIVRRAREAVLRGEIDRLAPALRERVHGRVVEGHPVAVLASAEADLLVVGGGGRHSLGDRLVGSVSERLLRHVTVPVVIVRRRRDEPHAERGDPPPAGSPQRSSLGGGA